MQRMYDEILWRLRVNIFVTETEQRLPFVVAVCSIKSLSVAMVSQDQLLCVLLSSDIIRTALNDIKSTEVSTYLDRYFSRLLPEI